MKCIIGLGNPGKKYENTRHNIGFTVIDTFSEQYGLQLTKRKFNCLYETTHIESNQVLLVKPQTFMNLSGEGVKPLIDFYRIQPENIVVIYDDLDLPLGKIRLRTKGGHGGHNGIRSLIDHLGTKEFNRVRIGIGRPTDNTPVVNYVLQTFRQEEQGDVQQVIDQTIKACETWFTSSFNDAMNRFNL